MNTAPSQYVPGVCNIGPVEIARRRRSGWIGLLIAVVLLVSLLLVHAPAAFRLLLFFPVTVAASGFLQAYLHFCAGFGSRGLFNFDAKIGKTYSVEQVEYRAKDRRKAFQILGQSVAVGIAVAIICFFL